METLWFWVVLAVFGTYAILDGFDLGSGLTYLFVARTDDERRLVLESRGQAGKNSRIWLLVAAGTLYAGFIACYSISAFGAVATLLLALIGVRGLGVVVSQSFQHGQRRRWAEVGFGWGSLLMALVLGLAVGHLVGTVSALAGSEGSHWFSAVCGLCTVAVVTLQSAARLAMESTGDLHERCRRLASATWWAVLLCYGGVVLAALAGQPGLLRGFPQESWMGGFAVATLAGLIGSRLCLSVGFDLGVFASASCVMAGLIASAAGSEFAMLLSGSPV